MTRERRLRLKIFCFGILPVAVLAVDGWLYVSMQGWTYSLPADGAGVFWPGVLGYGLVFFPLAALGLGFDLFHYWSTRESARWPVAEGRVTASRIDVIEVRRGRGLFFYDDEYQPIITYAYAVAGTTHSNDTPAISYKSREAADAVLRADPVGAPLRVYYDPADPGTSVLDVGDEAAFRALGATLSCAAAPFVMITLVIWFG